VKKTQCHLAITKQHATVQNSVFTTVYGWLLLNQLAYHFNPRTLRYSVGETSLMVNG